MGVTPPKPMRESAEEVVLSRADWEALLEALEDAEDVALAEIDHTNHRSKLASWISFRMRSTSYSNRHSG